ncbi:transglutaminase domain-containing protein [Mycoplasma putrefaciens]|uniref:MAG6410 family transglutaminase-related lipoprotein n=1 Tax=Mycoplasma putrefaciens TaxID=2123 RepID=UPI003DA4E599
MKKLLKYLTLLTGIGSTSSLSFLSISCDVNNKINKPTNDSVKPNNTNNGHSNSQNNNDQSNLPSDDPNTEIPTNDNSNNTIVHNSVDLTQINNKYLDYTTKAFEKFDLEDSYLNSLMLNNEVGINFYAHPDYKLNSKLIELDEHINKEAKVQLIDSKTNRPVEDQNQIKWYQRTRYPNDAVFGSDNNSNDKDKTFNLSLDGTVSWKEDESANGTAQEERSAMLYAEYKGYLYSTIVKVYTKDKSRVIKEEAQAREAAKKIVKDNDWMNLPTLERLTKAYEWITKNVKYDYTRENLFKNQSAYSALVERSTVCTGYAKGFQMICEELGIPCKVKEGSSSREANSEVKHAWNVVELDGDWYYVDPTSDRVEPRDTKKTTEFRFFLNNDNDFHKKDDFNREKNEKSVKFRNFKIPNFVNTVEDTLALIDNKADENTGEISELTLISDNFVDVFKAFDQREIEVENTTTKSFVSGTNIKEVTYKFKKQTNSNQQAKVIDVTKIETSNDQLAIQVKLDQEVKDLKAGNFNIEGALIKEAKTTDNGKTYTLFLEHFSKFGNVDVKLKSIKRKGYWFKLDKVKNSITFNIQKQPKPNAEVKLSDQKITLKNVDSNMQYKINNEKWTDITSNDFVIERQTIGNIFIRYKNKGNKISVEVQKIELKRPSIQTGQLKVFNRTTITGLSTDMEYKKPNSSAWENVEKNVLKDLSPGNYQIRIKAYQNNFASEIETIKIV